MRAKTLLFAALLAITTPAAVMAQQTQQNTQGQSSQNQNMDRRQMRREMPMYLMQLWRQNHHGERFRDVWAGMSDSQQKKFVADLNAQWTALSSDQQNAIRQKIQQRREQRRARRQARSGNGNNGDQSSADDSDDDDAGSPNALNSGSGDSRSGGIAMMTTGVPVTLATAIVTILALLFYFWTGINVARMRGKHGIHAPAMTGNPEFECAVRVQMNTLEWLVIFLPLLWLATMYFSPAMSILWLSWLPPIFGIIWIIGRFMYMQGYMQAPSKRSVGFGVAGVAAIGLLIMSIIGIVMAWMAATAA